MKKLNEIEMNQMEIIVGKTYALSDFKYSYTETSQGKFVGKVVFTI